MHIAFITIGFSPLRTSGLDISGERLIAGLLARGHQVTVIAGKREDQPETFHHPSLNIVRLPLGRSNWIGFGLRAASTLKKLDKRTPFDIIHFWDIYFAWAFRGRYVGSLQHSFHQRIATSKNVGLAKKAYYAGALLLTELPTIRRARGLLAGSTTSMESYLQHYRIPPEKVALARHGIDTNFFRPIPDTAALRVKLGLSADDPVLMYSGFFTARKGLEFLAQAIPLISPAPRLVLTGRWTEEFREYFFTLLGPARVQVIEAGFVPDEWMPAYFSLADVYVSSSLLEGFGLPIAESLACETPIVGADAGAVAEVAGPGGILVPPGDVHSLAEAVSTLLSNPAKRRELGQRGRVHVVENFSIETMVEAHLAAYQRFANPHTTQ